MSTLPHDRVDTSDAIIVQQVVEILTGDMELEFDTDTTDLLESGLLDSLAFVHLVMHIKRRFGVAISFNDLDIAVFRTPRAIAAYISERLPK